MFGVPVPMAESRGAPSLDSPGYTVCSGPRDALRSPFPPACFSEVSACEVTPVLGLNGRGRSVRENPLSADRTLVRSGRDAWPYGFGFEELLSHS